MIASAFPIIFTVIKLIFISLLIVLAALIVCVCAVVFLPFNYEITIKGNDAPFFQCKINWFYRLLLVIIKFNYGGTTTDVISIKFFGVNIFSSKNKNTANKNENTAANSESIKTQNAAGASKAAQTKEEQTQAHDSPNTADTQTKSKRENNSNKEKDSFNNEVKKSVPRIIELIKIVWTYNYKKEVLNACAILIKRLIKAFSNIKIKGYLIVGAQEPTHTGVIIGAIYAFTGITGAEITASGNFEHKQFDGFINISGAFRLFPIIYAFLCFVFNKYIWKIIKYGKDVNKCQT